MMHASTCAVPHWLPDVASTWAGVPSPLPAVAACATLNATGSASWTAATKVISVLRRSAIRLMSAERYRCPLWMRPFGDSKPWEVAEALQLPHQMRPRRLGNVRWWRAAIVLQRWQRLDFGIHPATIQR